MRAHGFTLLEVLVALAILSIALAAALRANMVTTDQAQAMKLKLLAQWSAENQLAELTAQIGRASCRERVWYYV